MRYTIGIIMLLATQSLCAQELFVFAEPASNMPAHSISAKLTGRFPLAGVKPGLQRYSPEIMFGLNKKWMVHASGSLSNFYQKTAQPESFKLYAKYRFLSVDEVHKHFRMAAFAGGSISKNPFAYDELSLSGDHSGYEAGLIATQLVHRFAASVTAGFLHAGKQPAAHLQNADREVIEYTISTGYLIFPKQYTSFDQPNLNIYLEAMGMKGLRYGGNMIDLAPGLQLILNSNFKINAGYRFQLMGDMHRIAERSMYFSIERTFLGALKRNRKR